MSEALPLHRLSRLTRTSVGRKAVMAITGVMLIGFLIAHLLGNLTLLRGPEAMNAYAAWIKGQPVLLWGMRLGLLAVFVIHIATGISLNRANRTARPVAYRSGPVAQESKVSRYMLQTGLLVLAFVLYHLLHFTLGVVQHGNFDQLDELGRHDVYSMVVRGFQNPAVAASYVAAMVILWFHLRHGAASLFQTLGLSQQVWNTTLRGAAILVSTLVVLGNITLPLLCLLGIVRE